MILCQRMSIFQMIGWFQNSFAQCSGSCWLNFKMQQLFWWNRGFCIRNHSLDSMSLVMFPKEMSIINKNTTKLNSKDLGVNNIEHSMRLLKY